jgi:hypothetical protein
MFDLLRAIIIIKVFGDIASPAGRHEAVLFERLRLFTRLEGVPPTVGARCKRVSFDQGCGTR